jgi:RNA polymerase sigma-70 factor (ECF subfamily)
MVPTASATVWPEHSDSCAGSSASDNDASDRALIAAIAQADQAAFRELHARYFRRITRFLRAAPYRSDLLDEIANDTLWVVWQGAPRFRGESKVSTWIMGIARKLSSNTFRAIRRRGNNDSRALYEQEYEPFAQTELTEWVCEALAGLPAEQRTVVELFYGLDQSCEEISRAVNCPIGTVKTRLFHGRRKLRELLPRLAGVSQCTSLVAQRNANARGA